MNIEEIKVNNFANENVFQAFCIKMISQEFPRLRGRVWHTKNEEYIVKEEGESKQAYKDRCLRIGNANKALGKLAGVMDILIKFNGILYQIELKQPEGFLTDSQKELHPIFEKDCPQIPPIICYTAYEVYKYCNWICKMNLKINFPINFKKYEID